MAERGAERRWGTAFRKFCAIIFVLIRFISAWEVNVVKQLKVIVEKHADGYVAYPIGLKGVVIGEGDTYEEALNDVKSAIEFHIQTFGPDVLDEDAAALEVFVAETGISI
jgi:predicted RNase H-like HicB family nuclease